MMVSLVERARLRALSTLTSALADIYMAYTTFISRYIYCASLSAWLMIGSRMCYQ